MGWDSGGVRYCHCSHDYAEMNRMPHARICDKRVVKRSFPADVFPASLCIATEHKRLGLLFDTLEARNTEDFAMTMQTSLLICVDKTLFKSMYFTTSGYAQYV